MGYKKVEAILPLEIIGLIQQYVDGKTIYIPKKENNKQGWGTGTQIRQELIERNSLIYAEFCNGIKVAELSKIYFLSDKSIQRIIRVMKR